MRWRCCSSWPRWHAGRPLRRLPPEASRASRSGAAATVVFPDGHQVAGLDRTRLQAAVRPSYLPPAPGAPRDATPIPPGLARQGGSLIRYLAQDVVFVLDQLESLHRADPNVILTGKLDLRRVGVFGISLGGIVVGEACRIEPRLRACLVMDAPMSTDVVRAGLQQPSMWITRDAVKEYPAAIFESHVH